MEDIDNFPCEDLRIIDTLWVSASCGHFGFSVQKEIYQSLGGKREYNEKVWNNFCDRVGWKRGGSFVRVLRVLGYRLNAPFGYLPRSTYQRHHPIDLVPTTFSSLAQRFVNFNI